MAVESKIWGGGGGGGGLAQGLSSLLYLEGSLNAHLEGRSGGGAGPASALQAEGDDAVIHPCHLHIPAVRHQVWPHLIQGLVHCVDGHLPGPHLIRPGCTARTKCELWTLHRVNPLLTKCSILPLDPMNDSRRL